MEYVRVVLIISSVASTFNMVSMYSEMSVPEDASAVESSLLSVTSNWGLPKLSVVLNALSIIVFTSLCSSEET